jgi:hypothetical protein
VSEHRDAAEQSLTAAQVHALSAIEQRLDELLTGLRRGAATPADVPLT